MRRATLSAIAASLLAVAAAGAAGQTGPLPDANELIARVNARNEGQQSTRKVEMELGDRRGGGIEREAMLFRRSFGDEKRLVIFYLAPATLKDTAFLVWDHADPAQEDEQWLYLPALRKTRRISTRDRGDYFLGTDLTYDDVKRETRVAIEDYDVQSVRRETVDGVDCVVVAATPKNDEIAHELGYSRGEWYVDEATLIVRRAEYWDRTGEPLKTISLGDIAQVDGIWTAKRISVVNHRNGHTTVFRFSEVDYVTPLPDDLFRREALARGYRP